MIIKLNESEIDFLANAGIGSDSDSITVSKFKPGQYGVAYGYPESIDDNPDECYPDWLTLRADSFGHYEKLYWDLDPTKELFDSLDDAVVFAHKYLTQSDSKSCHIFKILSKNDFLPVYTVYNQNKKHISL